MPKPSKPIKRRLSTAAREGIAPLSQTAEYALRAMTRLAQAKDEPALRAADLAADTHVPVHYLSKVLRRLVAAGLLESQKGHGGGFTLKRAAEQIRFADVLDAMGEAPVEGHCAFGWGNCDSKRPCPLHPAWTVLNGALQDWASKTTLADVAGQPGRRKRG